LLGNITDFTLVNWVNSPQGPPPVGGEARERRAGNLGPDPFPRDAAVHRPTEDPLFGPVFRFNYEMLQRIEVFDGYDRSETGELLLKKPMFIPLTHEIFNDVNPRGSTRLLCRMRDYKEFNFCLMGAPKNLRLPIYNRYFIIENPPPERIIRAPGTPDVVEEGQEKIRMEAAINLNEVAAGGMVDEYASTNIDATADMGLIDAATAAALEAEEEDKKEKGLRRSAERKAVKGKSRREKAREKRQRARAKREREEEKAREQARMGQARMEREKEKDKQYAKARKKAGKKPKKREKKPRRGVRGGRWGR
tara:strand:+ start:180 stop:1100 length:921 start_codon:yes stop_codon:yes gene_type:complete